MTFLPTEKIIPTVLEWLNKVIMNGVADQHLVVNPCTMCTPPIKTLNTCT